MRGKTSYWKTLVLLFFTGWILSYTNRTILSPLLSIIEVEWALSPFMLGLTHSVFFLIYTAMQIPVGIWSDRWGRKLFLLSGFLLQGIGAVASGLAGGIKTFLTARFTTGLGQSSYYANQYAIALNAIPPSHRVTGTAIINSGISLGMAVGMCLSSWLVYRFKFSWQSPFIILGLCTIALTVLMAKTVQDERGSVSGLSAPAQPKINPVALFNRNNILIFVISFSTMYALYLILAWLPYYLQTVWNVGGEKAGLLSTIIPFTAVFSGVFVGRASDLLSNRISFLKLFFPIAAVSTIMIMQASSFNLFLAGLLLYGVTGHLATDPLCVSLIADSSPPEVLATLYGIKNFITCIPTIVAPALTGLLVEFTGSFTAAFGVAVALQILSVICVLALSVPHELPVEAK